MSFEIEAAETTKDFPVLSEEELEELVITTGLGDLVRTEDNEKGGSRAKGYHIDLQALEKEAFARYYYRFVPRLAND